MPYLHKFQQHDFQNGFQTHDAILNVTPYEPEILCIGTYNHGWSWNNADFFYGRGMYMWTVMANLFLYDKNHLTGARTFKNNSPTFPQIFDICVRGRLAFADIVKGLKQHIPVLEEKDQKQVIVNNTYLWRTYKDRPLCYMASQGWIDDNVDAIVRFINETPSIKHVYFTFKSEAWLITKINVIRSSVRESVSFSSIFTPTANGFGKNLTAPYDQRAWGLSHCWVWNGVQNTHNVNKPGYGNLDHQWLLSRGVNPNNF